MTSPAFDPVTAGSTPDPAGPTGPAGSSTGRLDWRGLLLENLAVLVGFVLAGAAAGWVWERWATPPDGAVVGRKWNLGYRVDGDYIVGDTDSFSHAFAVVGTFVLVCAAVGLVLGVVAAFACRRSELVTLAVVAASSALAVFVCYRVGLALGPADPTAAAAKAVDGTMLSGDLAIDQLAPFVVLPLAALVGLAVTYFLTAGVSAGVSEAGRVDLSPADRSVDPPAPQRTPG